MHENHSVLSFSFLVVPHHYLYWFWLQYLPFLRYYLIVLIKSVIANFVFVFDKKCCHIKNELFGCHISINKLFLVENQQISATFKYIPLKPSTPFLVTNICISTIQLSSLSPIIIISPPWDLSSTETHVN